MATQAASLNTQIGAEPNAIPLRYFLMAAAIVVALQIDLIFAKSINWDEFFHFSQIHAKLRGEEVQWLQTPHVFLFGWVPSLPGTPIDHIVLIRLLILPFAMITSLAIYDIARRFTDRQSAAFAALIFAGGGNVFLHAFALRADMIAAALLTGSLWILATRNRKVLWDITAALLLILALIATIKSILYAPALAAMAAWRWSDRLKPRALAVCVITAIVMAGLVFIALPAGVIDAIAGLAKASFNRMFNAGLFPQSHYLSNQLILAPVLSCIIVMAFLAARNGDKRMPRWLAMGLMLPLLSVVIYRNAFPYFFSFILPPVAIAASLGVRQMTRYLRPRLLLAAILINVAILSLSEPRDVMSRQRALESGITEIFGGPVRYIDEVGFRPDFPRAIPRFASGWALENYHNLGKPAYKQAIQAAPTPFLLRRGYALEVSEPKAGDLLALLPEDAAALRDNYVPHWGHAYVAGKVIEPADKTQTMRVLIPGTYTLEDGPLVIDGRSFAAGSTVNLAKGDFAVSAPGSKAVTLRWGNNLPRPSAPYPSGLLFTDF